MKAKIQRSMLLVLFVTILIFYGLLTDVYKRQLWNGVKEAVEKNGFLGIFMGGFKASAVGISAALIFGYLASHIFEPKMKK